MAILEPQNLIRMEEYYYWTGKKDWVPFPTDLKDKLLEIYGKEPLLYEWSEQDIHQGSRKVIAAYFGRTNQ